MIVRYTPQQNDVAERMNKTLVDKIRCMLVSSRLPKMFWYETLMIACYIVNQTPFTAIDLKTPNEIWFGKPNSYSNMRVFGCIAYCYDPSTSTSNRAALSIGYCTKPALQPETNTPKRLENGLRVLEDSRAK